MANTISENPLMAKMLVNPDGKAGESNRGGLSDLVRASQAAEHAQNKRPVAPDAEFSASEKGRITAARMGQIEQAYQYSETMSLQLTTKEGDKVSIDFRQLYAQYQSYKEMQSQQDGPTGVRYFESREVMETTQFEERFAFSVQGDLNEDELAAIYNVFEQVDELANEFFGGNIEKALEKAVELEVDFGQLQSVQVNLTQTESMATRIQQAALNQYETVKEEAEKAQADEAVDMDVLPDYLQRWQSAIETLDTHFANANDIFDDMLSGVTAQRFPDQGDRPTWLERVKEFHQQLVEYAQQRKEMMESVNTQAEDDTTATAENVKPAENTEG